MIKKRGVTNTPFAAGQGLEPRLPGPEPGVLPLDDPARTPQIYAPGVGESSRILFHQVHQIV